MLVVATGVSNIVFVFGLIVLVLVRLMASGRMIELIPLILYSSVVAAHTLGIRSVSRASKEQ
jgi:hypothetical protein